MNASVPSRNSNRGLPPKTHPTAAALLAQPGLLAQLRRRWGSPLNVLFPEVFSANVRAFDETVAAHGLRHRLFYAHKANTAAAFVDAAVRAGIGIDVSSPGELAAADLAGAAATAVEATGPKGEAFLRALVWAGVTINVDNPWELRTVIGLAAARRPPAPVPILIRLSGFQTQGSQRPRPTRFGVPVAEVGGLLDLAHRHRDVVQLMGLSFHLDTADILTKALAAQECLDVMAQAWRIGLTPSVLDIGGGFRQQFVEDPTAFDAYLADLKAGLMGRGPSLTWDGAGLGFRVENGAVLGTPVSHKYGAAASGLGSLTELLATPLPGHHGRSLSRVLRDNMLEVWLEPGKALLDHAGLTLAQVEFVKTTADDLTLVNLDISRDHVCPVDQEILMDPIVVPMDGVNLATGIADEPAPASGPVGVYFAGRLCLERDMVTQHQVRLDSIPEPGDTVAFVNTAAYNMDLSASSAGLHAMPVKVVLEQAANGTFSAAPDGGTAEEVLTWPSPATSPS